ncbi:hypothetical protein GPECTOR_29g101 [Gonium pectorale]|uniref:Reverse transcriptase domain-containing protein n=1 Tax=Gonium pectorale TaxID=33097 RepID=A0A150GED3_GONPE|nr:hypothetical protein GPECTOR_29g101 [Gonium pectorale]|eukprot:KXZ48194.1 hypothetical protein GPECTOR_29g101 [Gonium pectorale]
MESLGTPAAVLHRNVDEVMAELKACLPDPERFRPGRLQKRALLWRAYFSLTARGRALSNTQKQLLKHLEHGYEPEWCAVDAPGQELVPERRQKLVAVTAMLAKAGAPASQVAELLSGDRPRQIHFPNHRSAVLHHTVVTGELGKAEAAEVVRPWPMSEWGQPTVIVGLLVVEKDGKFRVCVNPMYLNLYLRYVRFKYEQAAELPDLVGPDDLLFTTDDKKGYWQIPLHPSVYQYLAFRWDGRLLYWPYLPFGLAPACRLYTILKQELFRPLRERA